MQQTPSMFKGLLTALLFLGNNVVQAQMLDPINWSFKGERLNATEGQVTFSATLKKGWHLYSQEMDTTALIRPEPTKFIFSSSKEWSRTGKVKEESKAVAAWDPNFEMNIKWFEKKAVFTQKIKLKSHAATRVKGEVTFMVCDDTRCLPPDYEEFDVEIPAWTGADKTGAEEKDGSKSTSTQNTELIPAEDGNGKDKAGLNTGDTGTVSKDDGTDTLQNAQENGARATFTATGAKEHQRRSLWGIFIAGFLGGLLALLMPCIFPMIPLTVSFFTKHSADRASGIRKAILYGVSIVLIFVGLGSGITLAFGSDALNALASDGFFNFIFFVILVVFALSFLGAFEINLPNSWVNAIDSKADKSKGFTGIFLMAASLVLVSFSCTGPIIGTLLVETAVSGLGTGPVVGMTGFALALAIPFTLFAIFPGWMTSLPKSGSWLNSVKVVLGFLELALALKFLSVVDLAYHWSWLDRELFLAVWIVIFTLLGIYLMGWIALPHDTPVHHVGLVRLFSAIITFSFVVYMIPGMWGAPLKAISGFLPPSPTQDFDLYTASLPGGGGGASVGHGVSDGSKKKYADLFHCPHNLNCYFDYEDGMKAAREQGKPVMIDFTGHSCVNCRKMEASVWSDPAVLQRLHNDYILISLYVDDKTKLPEEDQYVSKYSGKKVRSIGNLWSELQAERYGANSQPYYVLLDHDGQLLQEPRAFDLDVAAYVRFLDAGKAEFKKRMSGASAE